MYTKKYISCNFFFFNILNFHDHSESFYKTPCLHGLGLNYTFCIFVCQAFGWIEWVFTVIINDFQFEALKRKTKYAKNGWQSILVLCKGLLNSQEVFWMTVLIYFNIVLPNKLNIYINKKRQNILIKFMIFFYEIQSCIRTVSSSWDQ